MSTYAAKSDIRRDTCNDVSEVAKTADLAGLKSEVDKTDAGKLETVPFNLRKLSNLVKKDVKNTTYDKLITEVDTVDSNKQNLEKNWCW